jgi:hypothetical protein
MVKTNINTLVIIALIALVLVLGFARIREVVSPTGLAAAGADINGPDSCTLDNIDGSIPEECNETLSSDNPKDDFGS